MQHIPIFIINLKKDLDKKNRMKKLCKTYKLQVEFFEAIEGISLDDEFIKKNYSKNAANKYFGRELTKGEIGTVLSHVGIYKKILDDNLQQAIILEDDIECNFEYGEIEIILKNIPKNWECLLLGAHPGYSSKMDGISSLWNQKQINKKFKCIRYSEKVFGAYGYMINQKGAKKMIDFFKVIDRPIDHWNDAIINLYGIEPSIVIPNQNLLTFSSLTEERNQYEKYVQRTFLQKCKDIMRSILKSIRILNYIFKIRAFLSRLKRLRTYE